MKFDTRQDAGKQLAFSLRNLYLYHPLIIALPRGGVPVGFQLAQKFHASLTVLIVRKITVPTHPELGIGAIAEGNVELFDTAALHAFHITRKDIEEELVKETKELKRRRMLYRNNRPLPALNGRDVIVVDDGLATGVTAQAAISL